MSDKKACLKRSLNVRRLIGLIIGFSGVALCAVWYDWKLLIIIMLLMWGDNITKSVENELKLYKVVYRLEKEILDSKDGK